ncbi:MAG: ABC transporter permease [Candidatus Diapherotrites archaeon]|nr:ABC transporter permease [Candidatus Diapherotrites archaeon]
MKTHSIKVRALPWLVIGTILLGWNLTHYLQVFDPFLFPSPIPVLENFFKLFETNHADILSTLEKLAIAITGGSAIGFLIGIVLYRFEWVYESFSPLLDFFRSIPATALFPLFLLFFGIGDPTNIALAVWIGALYLSLHVSKGLKGTSEAAVLMAKTLKKSEWDILYHVRLKEALPVIFVGLRTATSLTLVVLIVTEMFVGTKNGIGKMLIDASYTYNIPKLYAGILLIGLIGYLANSGIIYAEKRVVHWEGK